MSGNQVQTESELVWSSHPTYEGNDRTGHRDITGYIGDRPYSQDPKTFEITYTDGKSHGGRKPRKSIKRRKSTKRRKSMKKLHRRK